MFVAEVDLRARAGVVSTPRGIAALAIDPGSILDTVRVQGSVLRPGGLWQPRGGERPTTVPLTPFRTRLGLPGVTDALPELGIVTLQVFEAGDLVTAPPKRAPWLLEGDQAGVAATAVLLARVPFAGRRVLGVAVTPPGGGSAAVSVLGRRLRAAGDDFGQVLSTWTVTTAAAPASIVAPSELEAKALGEMRLLGGTDSLELYDELQVFVTPGTTGLLRYWLEASDEVNG